MRKLYDFECAACGLVSEHYVEACTYVDCTKCGEAAVRIISAPFIKSIVRGNSDFVEREKARLQKRADEHWRKQGRHEAMDRIKMRQKIDGI